MGALGGADPGWAVEVGSLGGREGAELKEVRMEAWQLWQGMPTRVGFFRSASLGQDLGTRESHGQRGLAGYGP